MVYLIVFIIILLFTVVDVNKKLDDKSSNFITYTLFLIFWLLAGLRYETGVDWLYYTKFFQKVEPIDSLLEGISYEFSSAKFEIGFKILNSILKSFTDNVQVLFILIAFISNILLFSSFKKYSDHLSISLLIYFSTIYFILDMSGIRQCIALTLFLWSIDFIRKGQFLKYLFTILFASLFHATSLILIPLYLVFKTEFSTKSIIIYASIGFLVSVLGIRWLKEVIAVFLDYFKIGILSDKLYFYTIYEAYSSSKSFGFGVIINFLILIYALIHRDTLKKNKFFNIFLNIYLVSAFFYYYTWEMSELSNRLRLYFLAGNSVLLTYFISLYRDKLKKILVFMFIVAFCLFYARIYIFQAPIAVAHNPYQNYIIFKALDKPGDGNERLQKHKAFFIESSLKNKE